ncbi:hypothetical protein [Maribacter sp. 2304DJ31-5]|uniref:hypothetical protein n=1 Tax=Maribacter sp. 2304DJ31-5 TaxID=3386273 RepID=UPI0039BC394A
MKNPITNSFLSLLMTISFVHAQQDKAMDNENYVEFNDRNNVVHGVYLGLTTEFGEINGKNTYIGGLKIAYVANRQFEVGFAGKFLYSQQDVFNRSSFLTEDLIGVYGGLHMEPIFFSKSRINLSFPLLVGAGAVGFVDHDFDDEYITEDELDVIFVVEPGASLLFNISRYLQLEAGIKYRFSSKIDLTPPSDLRHIDGFSGGLGIKVGIFNMGKNRYKKNI